MATLKARPPTAPTAITVPMKRRIRSLLNTALTPATTRPTTSPAIAVRVWLSSSRTAAGTQISRALRPSTAL